MKIRDLLSAKSGSLGTRIPGTNSLSRHVDFPELLLKQVGTVAEAAKFGGVAVLVNSDLYFFMCQDEEALLDTELTKPTTGSLTGSPGPAYAATTTHASHGVDLEYMAKSTDAATKVIAAASVTRWCAIVSPCNGFGYKVGGQQNVVTLPISHPANFTFQSGVANGDGNITASSLTLAGIYSDVALVQWRHVPVAAKAEAVIDTAYIERLIEGYPEEVRGELRAPAQTYLETFRGKPVGLDVVYTRHKRVDGSMCRRMGVGYSNRIRFSSGDPADIDNSVPLLGRYTIPRVGTEFGNPSAAPHMSKTDASAGVWNVDPSGVKTLALVASPGPIFGWDLDSVGLLPKRICLMSIGVSVSGMLGDFFSGHTPTTIMNKVTGDDMMAKDMPTIWTVPTSSAETKVGLMSVISVTAKDFLFDNDLITLGSNAISHGESRATGANLKFVSTERAFGSAEGSSLRKYALYTRGSTWNGSSKPGLRVEFSTVGLHSFKIETETRVFGGKTFEVTTISGGNKVLLEVADRAVGSDVDGLVYTTRGTFTAGGVVYGAAATATSDPGPSCVTSISDRGVETKL